MEKYIYEPNNNFDFNKVQLKTPVTLSGAGGGFFSKFAIDNEPFYIKTPKCQTKQGFVKSNNGKKIHCDLMFSFADNGDFFQWIENFVSYIQGKIYERKEEWFTGELTQNDIEDATINPIKIFKGGKYNLVRTTVNMKENYPSIKIYDSNLNEINMDNINDSLEIITLIEFKGIKFTLKSFQFEIEIKQMMVLKNDILEKCLLTGGEAAATTRDDIGFQPAVENFDVLEDSFSDELPVALSEEPAEEEPDKDLLPPQTTILDTKENHLDINDFIDAKQNNKIPETTLYEGLEEVSDLETFDSSDDSAAVTTVKLKDQNELYFKMYKEAKEKAKNARDKAIAMYLEAKNIKYIYNIEDSDEEMNTDIKYLSDL